MEKADKVRLVKNAIRSYQDFPKPGVLFRDIFGILQNVHAFQALKELLVEHVLFLEVNAIVGLDSRGFLIGPLISNELGKPFYPIRKKGKIPGKVVKQAYELEYGKDEFEIQDKELIGKKVVIVDDLLATGGSMSAAVSLLKTVGAEVVECLVVIELTSLKGRNKFDVPLHSIVQYDD